MWDLEPTERLVSRLMPVALLVMVVWLMCMSRNLKPEQLRPVFAPADSNSALVSRP